MTTKKWAALLLVASVLLAGCPDREATTEQVARQLLAGESKGKAAAKVLGNATCPVSGKPVGGTPSAPTFHSDFKGYRVGFMCPSCKGKFDSADDFKKADLLSKALQSVKGP